MNCRPDRIGLLAALVICACAIPPDGRAQENGFKGDLVIAGGGLSRDTESVWTGFIDRANGSGPFVIVPSASGTPAQAAAAVRDTLITYGVAGDRIRTARLALRDDTSTEDVNEADWRKNADDPATVELLQGAAAIWYTGGDQLRTTRLLLTAAGDETPALSAIKRAGANGAPIGGTSAGAAIMSNPMIIQGDTLPSLINSDRGEILEIGPGLGFFPYGLVDQHFGERARLGRLALALMEIQPFQRRIGFGIDENTALIVNEGGDLEVKGHGYVTIVDARRAEKKPVDTGAARITGLTLHVLASGDRMDAESLSLRPARWKDATVGNEYVEIPVFGGGGMAVAGQSLPDVIGEGLIDNKASDSVERISFDDRGYGVAYVFTQLPQSQGFWGRDPDGEGRYAIANIRFDIVPVRLSMETLK
ncbi:MAG: cyanophycinase [Hyphomonadaceae bacterium]|nr:cyanophycinase [Hyphomonadaceae bacterium]